MADLKIEIFLRLPLVNPEAHGKCFRGRISLVKKRSIGHLHSCAKLFSVKSTRKKFSYSDTI